MLVGGYEQELMMAEINDRMALNLTLQCLAFSENHGESPAISATSYILFILLSINFKKLR
jgi:hypothetical protein